ncbi:beta-ketoacyl synthase N-terminal-like domain-containing protein [Hyphomicrobium sp.]|uniref:beta-ketoacyl synthase N-terminal-like domain-containing protein n=1 Tax=Hyphomicrobium sp. TaxID=82 RepID=UPI002E361710|nr:beta-ketoacyl synthase N-terminal-like domain-containing protein [Hyphomicrobium sp.]HEX2841882.1 beta-ketoacyl synthase N-terminal-like domain-containing protein [Hyphomicrobium sp.]
MPSLLAKRTAPVVTGLGVATGFGYGKDSLIEGLFGGRNLFGPLKRPGRQPPYPHAAFIGAEVPEPPDVLSKRVARTAGLAGRVTVAVVQEAWTEARLGELDGKRIGLVVGGSNLQSRELLLAQEDARGRQGVVSPHLGYSFFDTDVCGLVAETFGIRGVTYTVGGASASGAIAVMHAASLVSSGEVDACIAVGALQDLSYFELHALQVMGALGPRDPAMHSCRPFDRMHDGFLFGESAAALVIQRDEASTGQECYGRIAGYAHIADGHRGPDPSLEGEVRAIRAALADADLTPGAIDYINAHGTGTPLGDDTEVAAYREAGLTAAAINATKSILGHGIASAGAVEAAVTLLQMRLGRLHPTRHLNDPIDLDLRWVRDEPLGCHVRHALSLSFGFGGINTALALSAVEREG